MVDLVSDLSDFITENWLMILTKIVVVALMGFFISSVSKEEPSVINSPPVLLPEVPKPLPLRPLVVSPPKPAEPPVKKVGSPLKVVPIRPAQIGLPDKDRAKEAAVGIVNSIPEILGVPPSIKTGFSFYAINPDGTTTDIPESNISFTVERGGRVRLGIISGTNIRVRMPATRLLDLEQDLCQGVKDILTQNEAQVDLSLLGALDKFALVSKLLPIRERCEIQ